MDDIVQAETVTEVTGITEVTPEVKPDGEPQAQPLTEERIQQLIAEETDKVRRQLQSDKDKAVNEVRREADRRVRLAEGTAGAYRTSLDGLDEDARNAAELAMLRSQVKSTQELTQEDEQRRGQDEQAQKAYDAILGHLKDLGIESDDKRLDWAIDANSPTLGRSRFDASIAKILQSEKKTTEDKQKQDFKDMESKLRKDLGLDIVEPSGGEGAINKSDQEFKKAFADGTIPITGTEGKKNLERYNKLKK